MGPVGVGRRVVKEGGYVGMGIRPFPSRYHTLPRKKPEPGSRREHGMPPI